MMCSMFPALSEAREQACPRSGTAALTTSSPIDINAMWYVCVRRNEKQGPTCSKPSSSPTLPLVIRHHVYHSMPLHTLTKKPTPSFGSLAASAGLTTSPKMNPIAWTATANIPCGAHHADSRALAANGGHWDYWPHALWNRNRASSHAIELCCECLTRPAQHLFCGWKLFVCQCHRPQCLLAFQAHCRPSFCTRGLHLARTGRSPIGRTVCCSGIGNSLPRRKSMILLSSSA